MDITNIDLSATDRRLLAAWSESRSRRCHWSVVLAVAAPVALLVLLLVALLGWYWLAPAPPTAVARPISR